MIKLKKTDEPEILKNRGAEWTKTLTDKRSAGEKPTPTEATRYRHPEIKSALVKETQNKCAYCESKLQHIHHGDVEHIMPKSLELEKILKWSNLTLACEVCNQNKSNLDPNANQIIDPYSSDPRHHLTFMGPFIYALGTPQGISTRTILDLDRPALIEARRERLNNVMAIVEKVMRPDIPLHARRIIYKDLVENEAASITAFSAMTLDAIESVSQRIPEEVKRP